jgi:hypothetical protein
VRGEGSTDSIGLIGVGVVGQLLYCNNEVAIPNSGQDGRLVLVVSRTL